MRRQGSAILLAALIAGLSGLMPASPARADSYSDLAAKVTAQVAAHDAAIDFQALRIAYAASAAYDPYGAKIRDRRQQMMAAAKAGDCAQVLQIAADIHHDYITHMGSYWLAYTCAQRLGDAEQARVNARMFKGLADAISATGDGHSPATAMEVVAIEEEYAILNARGLKRDQQALIHEGGHSYDKMDAVDDQGGKTTWYFNVDLPLSREAMELMGNAGTGAPAGQN